MVRRGLTEEVLSETRRHEEDSHVDRWGKNVSGIWNSKCKGIKLSIFGELKEQQGSHCDWKRISQESNRGSCQSVSGDQLMQWGSAF